MKYVIREDGKKLWLVKLAYKEPPSSRRVYRAVCDPADWQDLHDSEDVEIGEPARYGQWLSDDEVRRIREMRPANLEYMEPAVEVRAVGDVEETNDDVLEAGLLKYGVDRRALEFHGFFDDLPYNGRGVYVMVADTGYTDHPYLRGRVKHIWEFTGEGRDGLTRNMHGPWSLGAALPADAIGVSAKVLRESGSGTSNDIIASWMRFKKLCAEAKAKGVVSCSIGGPDLPIRAYSDAATDLYAHGIIVVAASGNDGRRNGIDAPANSAYVVSVGAHDWNGYAADFANRAADWSKPDLWACGVQVYGIGGYMSGTSMATPLVARAAANAQSVPGFPGCVTPRRVLIRSGGKTKILNEPRTVKRLLEIARRKKA